MNNTSGQYILTVNAGSSSIKMAVFTIPDTKKALEVAVENIGTASARLLRKEGHDLIVANNHMEAAISLMQWLGEHAEAGIIAAVGHRIVHGGPKYYRATAATHDVLEELGTFSAFDPEHMPIELSLVHAFQESLPDALQVLCFDTGFHHDLPARSQLLPIPRKFEAMGIRRYGFHGLSYAYILEELRRVEGQAAANGNVIIAHLGSGASLVALKDGKPIDTTMSMTPASGIPMSTRSGDLDPSLILYLAKTQGYSIEEFHHMVNFESGLLGLSGSISDMKELIETKNDDPHAKDAVDIFCHNVTKTIGAFAAALGGLNTLVFTGGMGENAPLIRSQVCAGLAFLGIRLDDNRNQSGQRLISKDDGAVGVHVIHTDEAVSIAQETVNLLKSKEVEDGSD